MTRIFIVRHGNTFNRGDVVTRVGARTDMPLTEEGKEQARVLGLHFGREAIQFRSVYSSPLQRTMDTTRFILNNQDSPPQIQPAEFLKEIDYGPDENVAEERVRDRIGLEALENWEKNAIPPDGWIVDPDALRKAWEDFFRDMFQRGEESPVLAVTSNGVARFALFAAGATTSYSLKLKTGAYGEIAVREDGLADILNWNVRP